jgi:hypothetical protein
MSERREITTLKNVDGASTATSAGTTTAHWTCATVAEPSAGVGRTGGMPDRSCVYVSSGPIA